VEGAECVCYKKSELILAMNLVGIVVMKMIMHFQYLILANSKYTIDN
jgi:hypothetical protein